MFYEFIIFLFSSASLTAIRPAIEEAMLAKCDKIISWNEEGGVLLLFGFVMIHFI